MAEQTQFLQVVDRDEAERRFRALLRWQALPAETVALEAAWGRVLAADVRSAVDVPAFDRSNFDGYAVRSADTIGAEEISPIELDLSGPSISTGDQPPGFLPERQAVAIATGAVVPRGADAIVMVEFALLGQGKVVFHKAVAPGFGISYAGTDVAAGETVLFQGTELTSRETGVLAAIGQSTVDVVRRPQVAVISTGDEIIAPGSPSAPGLVYDSNQRILADAIRELGGIPRERGIVADDLDRLREEVQHALTHFDAVILSGGTSKGAGDLSYRVVYALAEVAAHGVALKPGKPICLAAANGKPVVVLPGFPTSAIFTFHEFVAPVIRQLAGHARLPERGQVTARLAVKVNSEIGRTEYNLVRLVTPPLPVDTAADTEERPLAAFPLGKGSGSVTTFSHADGFIAIDRHRELLEAGESVRVQLLGRDVQVADLVVIGSHCLGLDLMLSRLQRSGWHTKFLAVGSMAGLQAVRRGDCDLAGIHLLDPKTDQYNSPFLDNRLQLIPGYRRRQGIVFRADDPRFAGRDLTAAAAVVRDDVTCHMVNRNQGSGTRILIDRWLAGTRPPGYGVQCGNHHAVTAAVAQGRADWGVAILPAATAHDLGFLPLADEHYDFVVRRGHDSPALQAFRQLLTDGECRSRLDELQML